MKKVLFVSEGNTCRCVMSQYILMDKIKRMGGAGITVDSCGLRVNDGDRISRNAYRTLKAHKVKCKRRKSKQLKADMIDLNTIVITMTNAEKNFLSNLSRVYCMSEFPSGIEIEDVYGKDLQIIGDMTSCKRSRNI